VKARMLETTKSAKLVARLDEKQALDL